MYKLIGDLKETPNWKKDNQILFGIFSRFDLKNIQLEAEDRDSAPIGVVSKILANTALLVEWKTGLRECFVLGWDIAWENILSV